ncbi:MAG: AI-2E family transporter [Planctomycetota bacterium]
MLSLSENGPRWLRFTGLVLALMLLCWSLVSLRAVVTPIIVALILAYILDPLVVWFQRRGYTRFRTIVVLYAVGMALLLVGVTCLTNETIAQCVRWRGALADYLNNTHSTSTPVHWWSDLGPLLAWQGIRLANGLLAVLLDFVGGTVNGFTVIVLIPLLALLLLWHGHHLARRIHDRLPVHWRESVGSLATDINNVTANFFRERLVAGLVVGLVTGIGWTLVGVPYGLLLGAGVGLLSLVPFMSLLALPPTLLVMYFASSCAGDDWKLPVILTLGVFLAAQALEAFVLLPTITTQTSGLNSVTIVLALILGVLWTGWFGMLLAIPIAGTLKALAIQCMGSPPMPVSNEAVKPNETSTP